MDETGTPPGDPQIGVYEGVVEHAPSWDALEPAFRGSTPGHVVRLFNNRPAVQVVASHNLDADRARVTCARRDAIDLVGAGIFTATIHRGTPLPLDYGIAGMWDDEDRATAMLQGHYHWSDVATDAVTRLRLAREALIGTGYFSKDEVGDDVAPRITELWSAMGRREPEKDKPLVTEVVAVLPRNVDGHVAHAVIELLSQRWPTMELRGRSDGTVEVRVDPGTDARRRIVL